jgi:Cof subfamily protein (haloacid dehalogenase superfamily)
MWSSAAPWVERLGADSPVILYNGGQVLDFSSGRLPHDRRLPAEVARAALAVIREDPELQPHLILNDRVYVERPHPMTEAYAADDGLPYEVVRSLDALLGADPHKLLVIGTTERIAALHHAVERAGVTAHAVQSEPTYLEILPFGVSKGAALAVVLEELGLDPAAVIAVGDSWNDLEMIEAAGLGVAMGHAPEGVRARADHVCGTAEEDGLRDVIQRFVLGRA